MDLPEGFDLDALLAALPGEAPAGTDIREDFSPQSPYYKLRDARAEARAAERAADAPDSATGGQDAAVPSQWRAVRELATKVLTAQSKDLEIAAWLTEALVRLDGLRGLAAGATLIGGFAEAFWDSNLYPLPDEDGIVTRLAPVTGLNGSGGDGTLMQPLRKIVLWRRPDGASFAFWQYEQSAELPTIADPDRLAARLAAGAVPFEDMEAEARAQAATLTPLREQAAAALAAWQAMGDILDAKSGADSPPTSRIRELLQGIETVVARYAPAAAADVSKLTPGAEQSGAPAAAPGAAIGGSGFGAAVTRDDMLRELSRIADYFRASEPHSPLAYTLEEAVRRGRMSWPQLLEEIVPDAASRTAIQTALGIKPAPE